MFEVTAHFVMDTPNALGGFNATKVFETEEARDAALAVFPKFVKAQASTLSSKFDGSNYTTKPTIRFNARFYAQKHNAANETGAKRVRRFLKLIGSDFEYRKAYKNSFATLDEFIALLPA